MTPARNDHSMSNNPINVSGWEVSHHQRNIFRLMRRNRVIYVKTKDGSVVQCDRAGNESPTFIRALTRDHERDIAGAIAENFDVDSG